MDQKQSRFSPSFDLSSAALHVLAMFFMLLDHLWAAVFPQQWWLTCLGRIAFPIFAFLLAEGYAHTHDLKKYLLRMLGFALIAEVPFDLLYSTTPFYPYHQNVLWTYLIALCCMALLDRVRALAKGRLWVRIPLSLGVCLLGTVLPIVSMTDFNAAGVWMVLVFYFFRERKWWCYLGQFAALYWINVEVLGGLYYPVTLFGVELELVQQGFALLALLPIWLYRGRQGHHSKAFQLVCYGFYPVHCLVLAVLQGL